MTITRKRATISFGGSEAATYVFLIVSFSNGEKQWIVKSSDEDIHEFWLENKSGNVIASWELNSAWKQVTWNSTSEIVYYRALEPNTKLENSELIAGSVINVSDKILPEDLEGKGIPDIKFQAKVVQANGFANAAAAWNSVKGK